MITACPRSSSSCGAGRGHPIYSKFWSKIEAAAAHWPWQIFKLHYDNWVNPPLAKAIRGWNKMILNERVDRRFKKKSKKKLNYRRLQMPSFAN
jgi:hypothetical protein